MAVRQETAEVGVNRFRKDPFKEHTPWFLKKQEHGWEKRAFIKMIGHLAAQISQSSDLPFAVLGAGGGWESFEMAKVLGEKGKTNPIINLDINDEALIEIRKRAIAFKKPLPEAAENLVCGDLRENLPLKKEGFALVFLSSVLHEVQSADGWKAVTQSFKNAEEILAPGGLLVVREFLPPERRPAIVKLNTPWTKKFFENFAQYFRHDQKQEWDNEWRWKWENEESDQILTDSRFAYEIFLHARTFKRECDRLGEDRAFAFFPSWRELKERYTLATENFDSHNLAHDLIETSGEPEGHWAFFPHVVPVMDRKSEEFLEEQFSYFTCRPDDDTRMTETPIELQRMWIFFHRHPPDIHEPEVLASRERELDDKLYALIHQSFGETLAEERPELSLL